MYVSRQRLQSDEWPAGPHELLVASATQTGQHASIWWLSTPVGRQRDVNVAFDV